jgi:hypothetical protein
MEPAAWGTFGDMSLDMCPRLSLSPAPPRGTKRENVPICPEMSPGQFQRTNRLRLIRE